MYSRKLYLFDRCIRSILSLLIITLHRELWEGLFNLFLLLINLIYFNTSHNNISPYYRGLKVNINPYNKKWIRGIHTSSKGSLIWVYDITELSDNQNCLVKGAPFKTKTECANFLKTTRNSVTLYLDSNKIFNNK
jgi:hypothetical protein